MRMFIFTFSFMRFYDYLTILYISLCVGVSLINESNYQLSPATMPSSEMLAQCWYKGGQRQRRWATFVPALGRDLVAAGREYAHRSDSTVEVLVDAEYILLHEVSYHSASIAGCVSGNSAPIAGDVSGNSAVHQSRQVCLANSHQSRRQCV